MQTAGHAQLFHNRLERLEPVRLDLDLDPPQLHGPLPGADHDHGVVERDLRHVDAADVQREGPPPGPDLQTSRRRREADDGAQPATDRPVLAQSVETRRRQDLGDLQTLPQAAALGRTVVLEGHLVVPATAPCAHDEAGSGDAPVVAVAVGVDQPARRSGQRGDRPSVGGLDGERRERGEPPLHRPQVEGVELPLDLDRLRPVSLVCLGLDIDSRYSGRTIARPENGS